jgi:hypothetical protein
MLSACCSVSTEEPIVPEAITVLEKGLKDAIANVSLKHYSYAVPKSPSDIPSIIGSVCNVQGC